MLEKYSALSASLDERPRWRDDWKWLAAAALAGFLVNLAVRLLDVPNWSAPELYAGGERIMATHDAYGWLAGAKGVNPFSEYGMSRLAAGLHGLLGLPLWQVGFWAPAFLGSLSAVACALWGWLMGGRRGAIAAAFLGSLSPGFYFRSRVGYFDSDVFTLLMPLLMGFFLAHLLSFCCGRAWVPAREEQENPPELPALLPWLALAYGLVARVAHFAHDDIHPLGVAMYCGALVLAGITGLPGRRLAALRLLLVYGIAAFGGARTMNMGVFSPGPTGWAAIALAAGLAALLWKRPARLAFVLDHPWVWLALLLGLGGTGWLLSPEGNFVAKALSYFKPAAEGAGQAAQASGPVYAGITQSIREAKNVADWGVFLRGVSGSVPAGAAGALGILALLLFRPSFALLMPLMALGMMSRSLGVRFAMFGGPVFALGLCVGLLWLGRALLPQSRRKGLVLALVQAALALVSTADLASTYAGYPPTPVLSQTHAEALQKLGTIAPKEAFVWTWWDYGYATQYYAGRMTPSDGGRHAGRDIYPTALALATSSPRQAAQMILLAGGQGGDPARRWDTMTGAEVKREVDSLAQADLPLPKPPAQYLVVGWENVGLLYWISFYGHWNPATGTSEHAKLQKVNDAFNVQPERGLLLMRSSPQPVPVRSVDYITAQRARQAQFPQNPGAPHLVINDVAKQAYLMDDEAYGSMAVQLLIGDPGRPEVSRYFKLAHEGTPLVRIYEVLPPQAEPKPQTEAFRQ